MANIIMADTHTGGGGGLQLLASGSFTRTGTSPTNMSIPVSYVGTPKAVLVCVGAPLDATNQGIAVFRLFDGPFNNPYLDTYFPNGIVMHRRRNSSNVYGYIEPTDTTPSVSASTITANRLNVTYLWQPNTYWWYIWGVNAA